MIYINSNKEAPVVIKRDTTENWQKAVNFKPSVGTICIYDNNDGSIQLKIGDGKTLVNDLPNLLQSNNNFSNPQTAHVEDDVLNF